MATYPEANLLLIGVGGTLTLSSIITGAARMVVRNPNQQATVANLADRVKAWWIMATLLASAFLAGATATVVLFAMISLACLREFLTITSIGRHDRTMLLAAFYLILPAQYWFVSQGSYWPFLLFIPVCAFLVFPVLAAFTPNIKEFLVRIAETQWALMICIYGISYVPALLTMPVSGHWRLKDMDSTKQAALLAVYLILITEFSDIMQYVFGKLLGKHPILPAISPAKTIEGLVGGLFSATALGAGLGWITPFTHRQSAGLAFVIAFAGFLGGLVMSAIKRDRGIKDWGHLIPGHGGMLDRMDSLCFAAPVFFHLTRWLMGG